MAAAWTTFDQPSIDKAVQNGEHPRAGSFEFLCDGLGVGPAQAARVGIGGQRGQDGKGAGINVRVVQPRGQHKASTDRGVLRFHGLFLVLRCQVGAGKENTLAESANSA